MLKVVIIEDEKHSRETLRNLLMEFCADVEVVATAGSVAEGVEVIKNTNPSIVFLDIELQIGTGFDVLAQLSDLNFDVVFTTAYEHYAIRAIKFSSLDYLLKPIDIEELQDAVQKARNRQSEFAHKRQLELLLSNVGDKGMHRICLATSDRLEFVNVDEIHRM